MIKTWRQRCEEHPDHNGIVSEGMIQARMQEEIDELRAAIEQAQPNARTHHKMMLAMIKENWRSIDPVWKDDPELCHAMGYEAGYNDAVAQRVEPRLGGSGAGFESLPASPNQPEQEPIQESPLTHNHLWIGDLYGRGKNT